jgi:hypothetical protein
VSIETESYINENVKKAYSHLVPGKPGILAGIFLLVILLPAVSQSAAANEDGFFLQEISWNVELENSDVMTQRFHPDGTFEMLIRGSEGPGEDRNDDGLEGEENTLISAERGRYQWNPQTLMLERVYTHEMIRGRWTEVDSPYSLQMTCYFTDEKMYGAYAITPEGEWEMVYRYSAEMMETTTILTLTLHEDQSYRRLARSINQWTYRGSTDHRIREEIGSYRVSPSTTIPLPPIGRYLIEFSPQQQRTRSLDDNSDQWQPWVDESASEPFSMILEFVPGGLRVVAEQE